jgi:hypothetical protein
VGGTDAGFAPPLKTPTVVWRATVSRLGGERVRPVCGLCGSVSLSRVSRRSHQPHTLPRPSPPPQARGGIRPSCGELPSASQEPVGSSQASVALMGTSVPPTPQHSARCARGEQRPAEPGRSWPRAEPLYSTLWASERESGPVAVFLIPLVIETTPYRTDTSYSIFAPPNSRVPARAGHAEPLQLLRARYRPKATSHWYRNVLEKTRGRFVR